MFYVRTFFTRMSNQQSVHCQQYANNSKIKKPLINLFGLRRNHTEESIYAEQIVENICKGDKDLEKKLRILMLEVDVMKQDGRKAPDHLKPDQWQHLVELPSKHQRSKYLEFLFKTEKSKENQKMKKQQRRLEREALVFEPVPKEYPDDLQYGIGHQSMFMRIRDQSMNAFDNYRGIQSMIFGQNIVIDCSYEDKMVTRETLNAAKQLTFIFGDNRVHKDPYNLHLCNVEMDGNFIKQLKKNIPSVLEPWFPLNIHEKSYLDLFPKKDLVYLTPHCREELTTYNYDAIYIVGCMVDKINNEPISLAKAKRDGLKMAKLPLDKYLEWGMGAKKTLNINHMISILLDMKISGDWEFAFRNIPRRKLLQNQLNVDPKKFRKDDLKDLFNTTFDKKKFKGFKKKPSYERHSLFDDNERF